METFIETKICKHPFDPIIDENTKKLIIGTLPPEGVNFYFSNSSKTRLWDIIKTISTENPVLFKGSYLISKEEKLTHLKTLKLGLCDIIKRYERINADSNEDKWIIPHEYFNLLEVIENSNVDTLLFVYQSAATWFLHSLKGDKPKKLSELSSFKPILGEFYKIHIGSRIVKCILLPNPLNRGGAGMTLDRKLKIYKAQFLAI